MTERIGQHGEGIVIEVAGLQADDALGDVQHPRRHTVRAEAVDDEAVAALPEQAAEPDRRPHDEKVVDLVEVPLVEQEAVQQRLLAGEPHRDVGPADVELIGDQETQDHHHGRRQRDINRQVLHALEHLAVGPELQRLAEEALDLGAREYRKKRPAGGDRADGEDRERHQHHRRAFVGALVVVLVVRRAVEGLENEAPGVERRQCRSGDRHQETVRRHRVGADGSRLDDLVLGKIAGGERKAGQR